MSSLTFVGRGPRGDNLLRKIDEQRFGTGDVPRYPVLKPMPMAESRLQFSAGQAQAMKLLTFSGRGFTAAPHLQLENDFIQALDNSQSADEKAAVVEMLGRARSMNALPRLVKLLVPKEPVQVRTAAVQALARIGASTDPNSFTRTQLADTLLAAYRQRKEEMGKRLMKPVGFSLDAKLKETEQRKQLMAELKSLAVAISELNVSHAKSILQEDYRKSLVATEQTVAITQEMRRAIEAAEQELGRQLQKQYKKPIKEILAEIHPAELNKLKSGIKLSMDGQEMSLAEAMANIMFLEGQQMFASELLLGLMDGLAKHKDNEVNALLKLGLGSSHPQVKSKSLRILAGRNGVSYNADVYPNLLAADKTVRQAAMEALLASPEYAARQKAMELIMPKAFFEVTGGTLTMESLGQYVAFLGKIAENGDEYVQALSKRALNSDYDIQTRQIALLVLGMMTGEPAARSVAPSTVRQARSVIKMLAEEPPARTPKERDALILAATQMWVEQKHPKAIANAIVLADGKQIRLSGEDRENLLGTVLGVLQKDADQNGRTRELQLKYRIINVLKGGETPLVDEKLQAELEETLDQEPVKAMIAPDKPEAFSRRNRAVVPDNSVIEQLQPALEQLRPYLEGLLDHEDSVITQMLAARILGLLRDRAMVDRLVSKVRDPLQGRVDWSAQRSYRGNPTLDGANMRLNALKALGQMGDARALDVMLDAMDDPVLREYVIDPLSQLAKDVNAKGDEAAIARARRKLVQVLESPHTTRAMRAVRINAANALFQFKGGVEDIKAFAEKTDNLTFRRQALSALVSNNYALDPKHPDHALVKYLVQPELGVERLHAQGLTGKGVEMGVIDGGYVDKTNTEAFQDRVKLPPDAKNPEHYHPTMVMSTAAANGRIKGVAPDTVVYSDKWPDFDGADPMEVYKRIIEGKLRGENNVRVINNSWGFSNQNVIIFKEIRDILKEFKKVVDMAEKAGIQIVFAAGNDGENPGVPKLGTLSLFGMDVDKLTADEKKDLDYILDKVILVGVLNTQGTEDRGKFTMAEFSSVGDSLNSKLVPTVAAPGVDMMVYGWEENGNQPKELVNGTSFASPYVSGLIALMVQKNPKITPAQIREVLVKTAVKLPEVPDTVQGAGVVDPEAAVKMAQSIGRRARAKTPVAPPPAKEAEPAKKDAPAAEAESPAADKPDETKEDLAA